MRDEGFTPQTTRAWRTTVILTFTATIITDHSEPGTLTWYFQNVLFCMPLYWYKHVLCTTWYHLWPNSAQWWFLKGLNYNRISLFSSVFLFSFKFFLDYGQFCLLASWNTMRDSHVPLAKRWIARNVFFKHDEIVQRFMKNVLEEDQKMTAWIFNGNSVAFYCLLHEGSRKS